MRLQKCLDLSHSGHHITPTQTLHYFLQGKIPQIYHTFDITLIHSQKRWSRLMTPVTYQLKTANPQKKNSAAVPLFQGVLAQD